MKPIAIGLLLFAGAVLVAGSAALPPLGDPQAPAATHVSPRYIEQSLAETGAANMVTAVLADYRGYDTLGETTVIFTAAIACLLIIGGGARWRRPGAEP
jgi:multicomponent Na+:H+ antiporter subunit B